MNKEDLQSWKLAQELRAAAKECHFIKYSRVVRLYNTAIVAAEWLELDHDSPSLMDLLSPKEI